MSAPSWLRVAMVQFAPKLADVHANLAKARQLCQTLTPRSVDMVCFPEMIFTGYMFPDAPAIAPFLEHRRTGPTATFCAALARDLDCHVVAGFPERIDADPSVPSPPLVGANAALLYSPTDLVHTYHKSNLFPVDRTWACPGPGFTTVDLSPPLGRVAVAICFDLNVRVRIVDGEEHGGAWTSIEEGPYELATYCRREGVRVLILLNAWLKSREAGQGEATEPDGAEPDWVVLNYWAMRLRPLWACETPRDTADSGDAGEVIVLISNRFGQECGKTFAGSSAMFVMRPGSGRPILLHAMGQREEGVRVWTTQVGSGIH